jgi:methylamine utilization protein MauE
MNSGAMSRVKTHGLTRYRVISQLIAALFIILFIYTGATKLLNTDDFRFHLGRSPFTKPFAGFIAITLPTAELIVALLLMFLHTRMIGFYASFFLMVLFTGYIYAMLHYSYYVPCSCGGIISTLSWKDHLLLNSTFSVLAIAGMIIQKKLITNKT